MPDYNRYHAPTGRYYRVTAAPPPEPVSKPEPGSVKPQIRPAGQRSGPLSLLPAGLDAGDLMLAALLFFLYIETKDEDFLIILIVVGFSMLNGTGKAVT